MVQQQMQCLQKILDTMKTNSNGLTQILPSMPSVDVKDSNRAVFKGKVFLGPADLARQQMYEDRASPAISCCLQRLSTPFLIQTSNTCPELNVIIVICLHGMLQHQFLTGRNIQMPAHTIIHLTHFSCFNHTIQQIEGAYWKGWWHSCAHDNCLWLK